MTTQNLSIINLEQSFTDNSNRFALDVLEGLSSHPKSIPAKYFYDEKGSHLFVQITEQPEYYLMKCELEIIEQRKQSILKMVANAPFRLVELGVGDGCKTRILLNHFLKHGLEFEYVIVDCCAEMVERVVSTLEKEYVNFPIKIVGIVSEYSQALTWLSKKNAIRNIVMFLGSSIGNFNPIETRHLLFEMWKALNDRDSVYIGFDLKKDVSILQQAYSDAGGITKKFNLNLLERMNRELGANFDSNLFGHHCFYNPLEGRMESWLMSTQAQTITFKTLKKTVQFEPWEGIHVESSYKYEQKQIKALAEEMGFVMTHEFLDKKGYLMDALWQVKKN